jgi:hypothetical protein
MAGWRAVHVGLEGDGVEIRSVKLWNEEWRRTGQPALQLPHPSYPHQQHRFDIYEVGAPDDPVRFAAGELSNGVWGFYVRS